MRTLNLKEMEFIEGGKIKLCSDMGVTFLGAGVALVSPILGFAVGLGAWIGCNID